MKRTLWLVLSLAASTAATATDVPNGFEALVAKCAPGVDVDTMTALVRTESSFNPYAIGVVGGAVKQPTNFVAAMATIAELEDRGASYAVGLAQIHKSNFARFGIDAEKALDACTNLRVGAAILSDCYARAQKEVGEGPKALEAALSCYYSGNFETGRKAGYVKRVKDNAAPQDSPAPKVPSVAILKNNEDALLTVHDSGKESTPFIF